MEKCDWLGLLLLCWVSLFLGVVFGPLAYTITLQHECLLAAMQTSMTSAEIAQVCK